MAKLVWDAEGTRLYETGTRYGVLYVHDGVKYGKGVAWNGLTGVTESPEGAEAEDLYADDRKYGTMRSAEQLNGTIEAYTYPDEWAECDGQVSPTKGVALGQQSRAKFALCYRTTLGNDTKGDSYGYKLHLIYGATASPSEKAYASVNDSPEAVTFSWDFSTDPVNVSGHKPVASITVDSTAVGPEKMKSLEDLLYGTAEKEASIPTPDELIALLSA